MRVTKMASSLLIFLMSCGGIQYENDLGFTPSALANSPEILVYINGTACKDSDGIIGFCAKRIKKDKAFELVVDPRPYDYQYVTDCTDSVQYLPEAGTILKGVKYVFRLDPSAYGTQTIFNCTFLMRPLDRPEPIASFSRVTVNLVAADYTTLEVPTVSEKGTAFGKYSYVAEWMKAGKYYTDWKEPFIDKKVEKAIVESYNQRMSYYGY
jgi:hypothetical protein